MTLPDVARLMRALDATWPPVSATREGALILREGAGGGKRVSASLPAPGASPRDVLRADLIRLTDTEAADYPSHPDHRRVDPTVFYAAPVSSLAQRQPVGQSYAVWPPVAVMRRLWAAGGIGPARLAVMERAAQPKTALLLRAGDAPAGLAFVALDGDIAMVHALEVAAKARRQGIGTKVVRTAAHWAQGQGATVLALAVTRANAAAGALYRQLGMAERGGYIYLARRG